MQGPKKKKLEVWHLQFNQFVLKVPAKPIKGFVYGWYSRWSQKKFSKFYYFSIPVKTREEEKKKKLEKKYVRTIKFCEKALISSINEVSTPLS